MRKKIFQIPVLLPDCAGVPEYINETWLLYANKTKMIVKIC